MDKLCPQKFSTFNVPKKALAKLALLVLPVCRIVLLGQNQMCQCAVGRISKYFVRWKKNKTRSVGLSCRKKSAVKFICRFDNLSVSLMVVVSSATLAYNGFGLGEGGDFHHKC
jgi:hypothetical protein